MPFFRSAQNIFSRARYLFILQAFILLLLFQIFGRHEPLTIIISSRFNTVVLLDGENLATSYEQKRETSNAIHRPVKPKLTHAINSLLEKTYQ